MRAIGRFFRCTSILLILVFSGFHGLSQDIPVMDWAVGTTDHGGQTVVNGSAIDASGNTVVVGYFRDASDFEPGAGITTLTSAGVRDIFISKIGPSGNFLWAKSIGTTTDEQAHGVSIDANGNIYVVGDFEGTVDFDPNSGVSPMTAAGALAGYILKLTPNGDLAWVRQVGWGITSIHVQPSGVITVGGRYRATTDFDLGPGTAIYTPSGGSDSFVARYNANGDYVWVAVTNGINGGETVVAVAVDAAGNAYATGSFSGLVDFDPGAGTANLTAQTPGTNDVYLIKLNSTGQLAWVKVVVRHTALTGLQTAPLALAVDASENVFTSGSFVGETQDFDPGPADFFMDGNSQETYIVKLDINGNFVWAKQFYGSGSISDNIPKSIKADASGNLVVAVGFRNQVDFDPGPALFYLSKPATANAASAIIKLAPNGNFIWARMIGGISIGNTPNTYVSIAPGGEYYIAGNYGGIRDFDPTCNVFELTGNYGSQDPYFVTKISLAPTHTVTSISPTAGPIGTEVTITGTNFGPTIATNKVEFSFGRTATITSANTTTLITNVPPSTQTGNIVATVTVNCVPVVIPFTVTVGTLPVISSFTPVSGPVGTQVVISGANFSTTPGNNTVAFNGTTAVVTASTSTSITVNVPAGATTGKITVTVAGNTATSAANFTVTVPAAVPTITSFNPASGPVGTPVTITGTNFSTTPANNTVRFNGANAVVTASTATSITTSVPAGATTGKITVQVSTNTATSVFNFTVTTPGNGGGTVSIDTETLGTAPGGTVTIDLVSLITTDGDLDINSIEVVTPPASGASASITNGVLTVDYTDIVFVGAETVTVRACDTDGNCSTGEFLIEVSGDVVVFNAVSPDGKNPIFRLQNIDLQDDTRQNTVRIYNRWGDEVFSVSDYNNTTNVFKGLTSDGGKLPSGTYFYKVEFASGRKSLSGYLELKY